MAATTSAATNAQDASRRRRSEPFMRRKSCSRRVGSVSLSLGKRLRIFQDEHVQSNARRSVAGVARGAVIASELSRRSGWSRAIKPRARRRAWETHAARIATDAEIFHRAQSMNPVKRIHGNVALAEQVALAASRSGEVDARSI